MGRDTMVSLKAERNRLKQRLEQLQEAMKLADRWTFYRSYNEWMAVPLSPVQEKAIRNDDRIMDRWLKQLFDGDRTNVKPDKSYDVEAVIDDAEALPTFRNYLVRGHYTDDEVGTVITRFWGLVPA